MKITFVNYSFAGSAEKFAVKGRRVIGGGEVYLRDLCHLLDKHGYETSVLQGGPNNAEFEYEGIPVRQIKSRGRYWFNFEWPFALRGDEGIIHLHDANHAWPFARGFHGTFHGVSWDLPFEGGGPIAYAKWLARYHFFKILIHHAIRHLKTIVSVDSVLLRYVQSEFPQYRNKIRVIPNYVDTALFKAVKRPKNSKPVILFPRNLSRSRGTLLTLNALKLISRRDFEVWFVGTGPELPAVQAAAKFDPRIKILGHLDHDKDMPPIYNQSDIVLIPSLGVEGTSLSCLEAMACAKPVIAGNVGGLVDIIENGRNGILTRTTPSDLAANISKLLSNDALRKDLGRNAVDRAQEFSRSKWEASWLAYVREAYSV